MMIWAAIASYQTKWRGDRAPISDVSSPSLSTRAHTMTKI